MVETTGGSAGQGAGGVSGKPEPTGKPNGVGSIGAGKVNGVNLESAAGTGDGKSGKRVGVKPGSKRGPYRTGTGEKTEEKSGSGQAQKTLDLDALSRLLISFNLGLAFITKTPELRLDDDEAKLLTDSYANLARFYPNIAMPEKTAAWLDVISTFGGIYGSKIMAAGARKKMETKTQVQPVKANPANVKPTPSNPYDLPPELRGSGTVKPPEKPKDIIPPVEFEVGDHDAE